MVSLLGTFVPVLKESPERLFQYNQDYIFDGTKFEKRFGISAIAPKEGIKNMISELKIFRLSLPNDKVPKA